MFHGVRRARKASEAIEKHELHPLEAAGRGRRYLSPAQQGQHEKVSEDINHRSGDHDEPKPFSRWEEALDQFSSRPDQNGGISV